MMATLQDVEQLIDQNQHICDAGRAAPDELIDNAEHFLDVRFPNDFRAFLKRWGTLAIGPLEFYCLDTSDVEKSRIVAWDNHSRKIRTVKAESLFDFILSEVADYV